MKIYYRGFNLYYQYPHSKQVVDEFVGNECEHHLQQIEFTHSFGVYLVAGILRLRNHENDFPVIPYVFKQISSNSDKILCLTQSGNLYKILENTIHQIDQIPLILNEDDSIAKIACGEKLAVALTQKGSIYNIPNLLEFRNGQLIDIQAGREHCLLLDANGNIFSFGNGSRGQLGHGNVNSLVEPSQIEALAGIKISKIFASGWHSCAVSHEGDLYVWGWNGSGQLGLTNNVSVMASPHVVDFGPTDVFVEDVAGGSRHTIALLRISENVKELWGCGWNKYKQLESSNEEIYFNMRRLHRFVDENVVSLHCGNWNSCVLCN